MKKLTLIIFILLMLALAGAIFTGDSSRQTLHRNRIHIYTIEGYTYYARGYGNILTDERWNLGYIEMDSVILWYNETIEMIKIYADSLRYVRHPLELQNRGANNNE